MLHLTYTLLLTYLTSSNSLANGLKNRFIYQIEYGFLIPQSKISCKSPFYCSHDKPSSENDEVGTVNDNLNIYTDGEDEINFPSGEDEGPGLDEDPLKKLGLYGIEHVKLSEEDEIELQKILDKHIELHKSEFECSETQGDTEVLKKQMPKKFDINASDDEFEVENYNGKLPDEEEIENYLDPLNLRKAAPKEEFTKRMIGRTYNLLNIPDEKYTTHCIDGARRFLYSLPLDAWNQNEKFILDEFVKRKRIKDQANIEDTNAIDVISPDELLNSSPSSTIGLTNCHTHTNNINDTPYTMITSVPQHIIEYTHYDLLKDLRAFKRGNSIINSIDVSTLNDPLFIRLNEDNVPIDTVNNTLNKPADCYLKLVPAPNTVAVYTVWPTSTLNSTISQGEFIEIEGNYMFNTEDESFKSFNTDNIPNDEKYRSAIILLENELGGAQDHRIRDLADELSCISRFPIFIPQITSQSHQSFHVLDRLIKNIQILYKIERISLVSFGKSSKFALDYCYDRLNGKEYLNNSRGVLTLYEITKRTTYPLNLNIFDSGDFYDKLEDAREIERAQRLNPVRSIKDILQCLVFWDARNINLDKALSLGTPLLNIISGNPIANSDGLSVGMEMLKSWKDIENLGYIVNCEVKTDIDIFNILRPKGKIIYNFKDTATQNQQDGMNDVYKTGDNKKNYNQSDMGTAFKIVSFRGRNSPIYLLPHLAEDDDIKEYNQALIYVYQWILHYTE
ncbi:hypothetical protein BmR1_04g09615 [Babesia microti strain RI]|uniref:Uncharacterized protein n=1 Tax=Babesia microti (strain RI) TaxID=1133968 RepID=A0A1N6LYF2_BABMR|nr:hypothetical protein BmR1_04g09615 [Babesia microti strain RI]SIO73908.1 hypothetical protein BmR1_04g09615 [Babesia microti strain RI]|eukprot:XP_021337958.1 hypothetical protein BmR1_04g09615 [Babesia microti strain RI]